jgi:hypothetical protein
MVAEGTPSLRRQGAQACQGAFYGAPGTAPQRMHAIHDQRGAQGLSPVPWPQAYGQPGHNEFGGAYSPIYTAQQLTPTMGYAYGAQSGVFGNGYARCVPSMGASASAMRQEHGGAGYYAPVMHNGYHGSPQASLPTKQRPRSASANSSKQASSSARVRPRFGHELPEEEDEPEENESDENDERDETDQMGPHRPRRGGRNATFHRRTSSTRTNIKRRGTHFTHTEKTQGGTTHIAGRAYEVGPRSVNVRFVRFANLHCSRVHPSPARLFACLHQRRSEHEKRKTSEKPKFPPSPILHLRSRRSLFRPRRLPHCAALARGLTPPPHLPPR